jgi:LacI family transcriptional regulator
VLDALMRGKRVRPGVRTIEPLGIATRQSTDVLALADPQLAAAVRFIRANACLRITVADAARHAGLSRSSLERGFRTFLQSTPHDEILRTQLARAKELLAETDFPLRVIARRVGFQHPEYLSAVFRKHVHMTPTDFRSASQA